MELAKKIQTIDAWLDSGSINLFGLPYTGKDTQGRKLADALSTRLIGGGDILRGEDMPPHIKQIMTTGELIPTDDYVAIVLPKLSHPELAGKPLILSSVGRWHGEEASVITALEQSKHPLKAVIHLEIPETVVWQRWQKAKELNDRGARADEDSEEKIQRRLKEFATKTKPVIDFYEAKGLLVTIDGNQSREQVTEAMFDALVSLARRSKV